MNFWQGRLELWMITGELQPNSPSPMPEEETKMMGFTILQCKSCRSIVGDTSSLQIYNKETALMTLQSTNEYFNLTLPTIL